DCDRQVCLININHMDGPVILC
ncbi:unnamed protein product, partial [Allacma fusca]